MEVVILRITDEDVLELATEEEAEKLKGDEKLMREVLKTAAGSIDYAIDWDLNWDYKGEGTGWEQSIREAIDMTVDE